MVDVLKYHITGEEHDLLFLSSIYIKKVPHTISIIFSMVNINLFHHVLKYITLSLLFLKSLNVLSNLCDNLVLSTI